MLADGRVGRALGRRDVDLNPLVAAGHAAEVGGRRAADGDHIGHVRPRGLAVGGTAAAARSPTRGRRYPRLIPKTNNVLQHNYNNFSIFKQKLFLEYRSEGKI